MERTVIYGPPGTGKTTRLISIMEDYIAGGGQPNKIGFTSFTRRSIEEATRRVEKKFGYVKDQLPFFRTVHSLCMGLTGFKNSDVVQWSHKKEIAKLLGLELTFKKQTMDGTSYGMKDGDKMFHISDYYRAKGIDLEQAWEETGADVDWDELKRFDKAYTRYKDSKMLVDFTDMLSRFLKEGYSPKLDVLFVDESQDLSTLQWEVIFKVEQSSSRSYIAGDDDQGIYGWNGANVSTFIDLPGDRIVLDKSYRLNKRVLATAMGIIRLVSKRVDKHYTSRDEDGLIEEIHDLDDLPISEGEWLLLARNGFLLRQYEDFCFENGIFYETSGGYGPGKWPEFQAILIWENFRSKGINPTEKKWELIQSYTTISEVENVVYDEAIPPWFEVLDAMTPARRDYFRRCKENGEKLLSKPRVHINTIHGVKGGEAQNVCLMLELANTTWKNMENDPDEEHRVFYVAVTRAIDNLYIKLPFTNKFYDLEISGN